MVSFVPIALRKQVEIKWIEPIISMYVFTLCKLTRKSLLAMYILELTEHTASTYFVYCEIQNW